MTQTDTKDRILDAAERLFSEQGISVVSLRHITSAAKVNLAAVNYHFGSKERLIHAVFERRIGPVNRERLRRLGELESRSQSVLELEDVLDAFFRPAFELSSDPHAGSLCTRLVGRLQSEANPVFQDICNHQFQEVGERFGAAIGRACPRLRPSDFWWRFQFLIGAMVYTMTDLLNLHEKSGGLCNPRDVDAATRQLIQFAASGLRAQQVSPIEEGKSA